MNMKFHSKSRMAYEYDNATGLTFPSTSLMERVIQEVQGNLSKEETVERLKSDFNEEDILFWYNFVNKWSKFKAFSSTQAQISVEKPGTEDVKEWILREGLHQLTLCATEDCNFRCKYCVYSDNYEYSSGYSHKYMNFETVKKGISWIKISKPWNNPFAERGIRTIKHEYVNQVWIGNFSEFEKLSEVIKPHYNECRPHQSFDNKTPAEVRIAVTGDKRKTSEKIEKRDTFFRTILGRLGTAIS